MIDSQPYVVGKFYEVETVYGCWYNRARWWPVLGQVHSDAEIIGFRPYHFHIDWRFCSAREWGFASQHRQYSTVAQQIYGVPLCLNDRGLSFQLHPKNYQQVRRRLKCKRDVPAYPTRVAPWIPALEAAHAGECLKHGICPHRGYDLTHEPVVDGVVTCPLHGLRFRVATGALEPLPPEQRDSQFPQYLAGTN